MRTALLILGAVAFASLATACGRSEPLPAVDDSVSAGSGVGIVNPIDDAKANQLLMFNCANHHTDSMVKKAPNRSFTEWLNRIEMCRQSTRGKLLINKLDANSLADWLSKRPTR